MSDERKEADLEVWRTEEAARDAHWPTELPQVVVAGVPLPMGFVTELDWHPTARGLDFLASPFAVDEPRGLTIRMAFPEGSMTARTFGSHDLTVQEHRAVQWLAKAWNEYCAIAKDDDGLDEWDAHEFAAGIHALQHTIMAQAARRANPGRFR